MSKISEYEKIYDELKLTYFNRAWMKFDKVKAKYVKGVEKDFKWGDLTKENYKSHLQKKSNIYALVTGKISNITAVDVDLEDSGLNIMKKKIQKHGEINTWKAESPSGGWHYFLNMILISRLVRDHSKTVILK